MCIKVNGNLPIRFLIIGPNWLIRFNQSDVMSYV
uniref:Uncharacterized protein n=1 Tax=Anopheles funestus TaxID=62324 RepID=A0A182S3L2_ANOFN